MTRFFGKTSGKVDDKGRIVFPAVYRDAMVRGGESDMTLIIKKSVQGTCLNLFTLEEWTRRSDKVLDGLDTELNSDDGVFAVVPDGKLGRLNIPSELLEQVGITKEVEFAGVGYKIEIWAKEKRAAGILPDDVFQATAARLSEKK